MIKIILIVVVIAVCLYFSFPLVMVCENSMFPTYIDQEVILCTRFFRKSRLKVGDVVIYRCPTNTERLVVKRIGEIHKEQGLMYCLGDNPEESYDSRNYGYVSMKNLKLKPIMQRKQKVR